MILAVDLGSTLLKVGLFDDTPTLRGAGARAVEYRCAPGGRIELEVDQATSALTEAIHQATDDAEVLPEAIRAIAVTSQAQTFTVVDSTGRPKMPFISWQDTRADEACRRLAGERELADFGRQAGFGQLLGTLQISQLAHLSQTQPGFLSPDDRVLHLPTFFVRSWTAAAVIDNNLAAMSGLYSLTLEDWWPAALEACGLRREQLPELTAIGNVAAHTDRRAAQFGLPEGVPVILAGNDQTAGAYGAGLHANRGVLLTLGTALVAYVCRRQLPPPAPDTARGPYPGGLHYRLACDGCGVGVVGWARGMLPNCTTDADFFRLAEKAAPGCRGLIFDADLPGGNGAWRNIALDHTPAEFARSVIESISHRMAELVRRLDVEPSNTESLMAGGGSRQPLWVRILSDVLRTPLTVTEADPLRGAAMMARPNLKTKENTTSGHGGG